MTGERETSRIPGALRRDLSLVDAVGVGLGAIVGAGLFVVSGVAAGVAGPAFLAGLVLAGAAAACNALSSAQLAAAFPQAGGTYEYGYRTLNDWAGFAAGWMFLASKLAAGGTVALGFANYLARLAPGIPLRASAVAATILLTALNFAGIRKVGRLNTLIVAVTMVSLAYFASAALPAVRFERLAPLAPHGWPAALRSAALLFFAYTGYARIATLGEEVREPRRTIPRAIVISLGIAAVVYFLVCLGAVGTLGAAGMAASAAPIERAAVALGTPGLRLAVALGATTAMFGVLLSQLLGISRMMFAMARRGDLPAALAGVHAATGVPGPALVLTGAVIAVVAMTGTIDWVASAASFTILLYYGITNAAALRLAPDQRLAPSAISWTGLVLCALLAVALQPATILAGIALLGVGVLGRLAFRRRSAGPPDSSSAGSPGTV